MNIKKQLNDAYIFCQQNQIELAENIYYQILKKFPNNFEALANLGLILIQKKNFFEAEKLLSKAIKIKWDTKVASNYFNILFNNGKIIEAEKINEKLIEKNKNQIFFLVNRARILNFKGQFEEALKLYLTLLTKYPDNNDLLVGIGYTYNRLKKFEEAISAYEKIILLQENNFIALYNSGVTRILNQIDLTRGIMQLETARQIVPNNIDLLLSLASGYEKANQIVKALAIAKEALKINPNSSIVHYQIGSILNHMENEDGVPWLESSLKIDPKNYRAIFALSQIYLRENKYEEGMRLYKWRVKRDSSDYKFDDTSIEEIKYNENILIFFEQGIGDQIIFLRYIEHLLKKSENLVIFIKAKIIDFVKENIKEIRVYSSEDYKEKDWIDYKKINLGSIPRLLLDDIKKIPSFQKWRPTKLLSDELNSKLSGCKRKIVGVSWKSSNKELAKKKNIQLKDLVKVLDGYLIVNLQYGDVAQEIENSIKHNKSNILNFKDIDLFNDINSLTNLINKCDLIITISNINAHIAGALSKKTYLLAPRNWGRLWYWVQREEKSLYYPSIKIIEQEKDGDWDSSLLKLKSLLEKEK